MDIIQGNIQIAKMMGAIEEQWYPYNKHTGNSGIYLVMPYGKFFPNGKRYCGDYELKYHSDWNWVHSVLNHLHNIEDDSEIEFKYFNKVLGSVIYSDIKTIFRKLVDFTLIKKESKFEQLNLF